MGAEFQGRDTSDQTISNWVWSSAKWYLFWFLKFVLISWKKEVKIECETKDEYCFSGLFFVKTSISFLDLFIFFWFYFYCLMLGKKFHYRKLTVLREWRHPIWIWQEYFPIHQIPIRWCLTSKKNVCMHYQKRYVRIIQEFPISQVCQ